MKKILLFLITLMMFGCIEFDNKKITGSISIISPENETKDVLKNNLVVSWESDSSEKLEYKVNAVSSDGTVIQKSTNEKSIQFINLQSGENYKIEVVGYLNGDKYGSDSINITTKIGSVNLLSPENLATGIAVLPTLAWSSNNESDSDLIYDLYVGEKVDTLSKIAGNISRNSFTLSTELNKGSKYFWKVVEKNSNAVIIGESDIYSFTIEKSSSEVIENINISLPATGDLNVSTEIILKWSYSGDYSGLTFKIYMGTNSNSLNLLNSVNSSLSYTISGLSNNTKYFWKVVAFDSLGNSEESDVSYFTTESEAVKLSIPVVSAPLSGATGVPTSTILKWNYSGEYSGLTFKVYMGTSSSNITLLGSEKGALSYSVSGLNNNTKYFWKVEVLDSIGNIESSEVSYFTTESAVVTMSTPIIVSPIIGATNTPLSTDLIWSYNGDYSNLTFEVYMGTSSSNLTLLGKVKGVQKYTINNLINSTKYYWMVTAVDVNGNSTVSAIGNFTTLAATVTLSTPVLTTPTNGATGVSLTPNLGWSYSGSYSSLTFELYVGTTSSTLSLKGSTTGLLNYSINGLSNNTKYYWKVIAKDSLGNTKESTIGSFTTLSSTVTTKVAVIGSSCNGCQVCLPACSKGALKISGGKAVVDVSLCNGCGSCVSKCRKRAITIK